MLKIDLTEYEEWQDQIAEYDAPKPKQEKPKPKKNGVDHSLTRQEREARMNSRGKGWMEE